ncbi:MAG: biotin/lipoyl-binding protein, partial [Desulfobacteraceae bacterium]|nr:biotin/lipoyl-binding protein [Desulfobacteraceae bacterium]
MGRIRWWAGLFFVVLALALIGLAIGRSRAPKTNYRTSKIERGDLTASIASTGVIAPLNTVEVGSQVSGVIKKINVDYNSKVVEKQILAHIDDAMYSGQVAQAKAQLERARMEHLEKLKNIEAANATVQVTQAQLFSAKATRKDAERSFNRLNSLAKSDIVADADRDTALGRRDTARGGLEMAKAQLNVAKAQLAKAIAQGKNALAHVTERQAGLKLAEIQLTYCTIRSPINGEVIQRNVDQGQTVAATLQSPTLFTIAEDLTRIQVE